MLPDCGNCKVWYGKERFALQIWTFLFGVWVSSFFLFHSPHFTTCTTSLLVSLSEVPSLASVEHTHGQMYFSRSWKTDVNWNLLLFAVTAVQSKAGMVCKCFAYKLISHNLLHEEVKYRWLQYHKVQQHTQFPIPFAENIFQSSFSHRKSLIEHCERSELRSQFEWTKVN